MTKLSLFCDRRRTIVEKYNRAFGSSQQLSIPFESSNCESNFHLYVLKINFDTLGISRMHLMGRLEEEGIETQVHYIPLHLQPYYKKISRRR